eukprot:jgi/Orpsp1_1/1182671/evm.model.c7180000082187.2
MNIHDISLPIFICEPRSLLEKVSDFMCYPQFLIRIPYLENPLQRFVGIIKFALSCWSLSPNDAKKPFNPVLGEYFRARWKFSDHSYGYYIGEQTSINPPISSYYFCNPENGIVIHGEIRPKTKFSGTNLKTFLKGGNKIIFHKHYKYNEEKVNNKLVGTDEEYYISTPNIIVKNKWFTSLTMNFQDDFFIWCPNTQYYALIKFTDKHSLNYQFHGYLYKSDTTLDEIKSCINNKDNNNYDIKNILCNNLGQNDTYEIFGNLNNYTYIKKSKNEMNIISSIMNIKEESICPLYATPPLMQDQLESRKLWYNITKGIFSYYDKTNEIISNEYPNYSTEVNNKSEEIDKINDDNNTNNKIKSSSSSSPTSSPSSSLSSSLSSSSPSFHHEMTLKLAIENNQEKINQYISEAFQNKFINYLLNNLEILSHAVNNKDLKYINLLNIEDISRNDHALNSNTINNNNNNDDNNCNNKENKKRKNVKKKNTISVLEMNHNKVRNFILYYLSNTNNKNNNNNNNRKDKKYYTSKEFFSQEYFWWTPKYFQPYVHNIKKKAFDEMMTELLKYKIDTFEDNSEQLNQDMDHNEIDMDINRQHYIKVFNENNYKLPENIEYLQKNELQRNILNFKYICPLV